MPSLSLLSLHHHGTSELADLTLAFCDRPSLWGGGSLHSRHISSPVLTELHQMYEPLLFFLGRSVHPNTVESQECTRSPPQTLRGFCGIAFMSARHPTENQISQTIHQESIIGCVQPPPLLSRLLCLLQSSDVQPVRGLLESGGTEWISAFACDYYLFIPQAQPTDPDRLQQHGAFTALRTWIWQHFTIRVHIQVRKNAWIEKIIVVYPLEIWGALTVEGFVPETQVKMLNSLNFWINCL